MTKFYRIRIGSGAYVKCVEIYNTGDGDILGMQPTFSADDAAVYDGDKAEVYCKELNNNKRYRQAKLTFNLEEATTCSKIWEDMCK